MSGPDISITNITADDITEFRGLLATLSDGDITVIRVGVDDTDYIARLADNPELRWIARASGDDGAPGPIIGYATVNRLPGWSDHVGELRLVVDPQQRGTGLGRRLVQHALRAAVAAGMSKVMVELTTDSDAVVDLFTSLGFTGEALLRDHIRDHHGQLRDLLVLAHHVGQTWDTLSTIGVADALA
ncbi:MAG: GNAT family N-acetyltransferase [Gordonia sp. (in: high G+C Gram-positive bacteria)]